MHAINIHHVNYHYSFVTLGYKHIHKYNKQIFQSNIY